MRYSALYFIPNASTALDASLAVVSALVQGIEEEFPNAVRQNPWQLQYRAFRDTLPHGFQASTDGDGKPMRFAHTYQHHLTLTTLSSNRTYLCTTKAAADGSSGIVVAIPAHQREMYAALVKNQLAATWASRHVLAVPQGNTYTAGLCTIQIGEVHSIREGPQSGAVSSPGVLVCISTPVGNNAADAEEDHPSATQDVLERENDKRDESGAASAPVVDDDDDGDHDDDAAVNFDYADLLIRECWAKIKQGRDLGRSEVREVMMMPRRYLNSSQEQDAAAVRMWSAVLRLRG